MNSALDPRPIALVTGILLATLGAAMIVPALIDASVGNADWQVFAGASAVTMLVGFSLYAATRDTTRSLSTRQALLMTAVAWIALVAFGALPFLWSGTVPTYTDAFFESMSGLTTTGATVIVGLDTSPPGILLWRGILQWLGGLGIIVMAVAVLPMLQIGGMQLFKAEAFDTAEKILPRATQISGSMTLIFVVLTLVCALLYMAAGMTATDAAVHAMTTVATGGFSTKDASIGHYASATVDWIAVTFMVIGSIPFLIYVQMLQGRPVAVFRDQQVRGFALALATAIGIGWLIAHESGNHVGLEGLRYSAFNVVSIMTGTGYASTDYGLWGSHAVAFFFLIMFIGGCAGSTSCGVKIFRFQVLLAEIGQQMKEFIYPNGVFVKRYNGRILSDSVSSAVVSFIFLYFISFILLATALGMTGLDFLTAISGAGSAISNVGPGLGEIIGPAGNYKSLNDTAKWTPRKTSPSEPFRDSVLR